MDKKKLDLMASRVAVSKLLGHTVKDDEADLRDHFLEVSAEYGAKRFDFNAFGGQRVGSLVVSDGKTKEVPVVVDEDALTAWVCDPDNAELIADFAMDHAAELYKHVLKETGEVVPGMEVETQRGKPYTTIKVDDRLALPAMAAALPGATSLFALPEAGE